MYRSHGRVQQGRMLRKTITKSAVSTYIGDGMADVVNKMCGNSACSTMASYGAETDSRQ